MIWWYGKIFQFTLISLKYLAYVSTDGRINWGYYSCNRRLDTHLIRSWMSHISPNKLITNSSDNFTNLFHEFFPWIFLSLKTNFYLLKTVFFLSLQVEKEIILNMSLKRFIHRNSTGLFWEDFFGEDFLGRNYLLLSTE